MKQGDYELAIEKYTLALEHVQNYTILDQRYKIYLY